MKILKKINFKNLKKKQLIIAFFLLILGLFIDQLTKVLAFNHFSLYQSYPCIPGLFRFSLVENTGAAWGIMDNKMIFFAIITIIAVLFISYLAKDYDFFKRPIYSASLILVLNGTIGNFIDRMMFQKVRDFVTFDFIDFPSFNFADMCLTVGVIALSIDIIFGETGKLWTKE